MLASLLLVSLTAAPADIPEVARPAPVETAAATLAVVGAHFYIPGYRTGDFVTLLPSLRITRSGRWWGALVAPVHYLTYVGDETAGLGDLIGAFGYGFFRAESLTLDVGLWTQWPTGDPHQSLGSGHLILSPQFDAAWHQGRWVGRGSVAVRGAIAWGVHGEHNHQPLVAPHDLLDLKVDAAAGVVLGGHLELSAKVEPVVVFIPHPVSPVGTRVSAEADVALLISGWRIQTSAAVPLTVNRAWDWQLGASVGLVL